VTDPAGKHVTTRGKITGADSYANSSLHANTRVCGGERGRSHPLAANEIKQGAAAGLPETAVDKVGTELPEVLLLGDGVAADGDFGGNDEGNEGAVAEQTCDV